MLSLLVPSPESSGEKIDVFLQPLIDELIDLWVNGLQTYDVNAKNSFKLQAALLWTINDFPAYGMLSGWSVRGKFACPTCGFGTCSKWLENGGKYCFMGHHIFFPINHPFRRDRHNFDGNQEWRNAPTPKNGSTTMEQLNGEVGVYNANGEIVSFGEGWKRKSIFFTLPY